MFGTFLLKFYNIFAFDNCYKTFMKCYNENSPIACFCPLTTQLKYINCEYHQIIQVARAIMIEQFKIVIAYTLFICYNINTKSMEVQYGYTTNSYR